MDAETIAKRIAELRQQKDAYVQQANQVIGQFDGRIAELERLLAEIQKPIET